MLDIKQMELTDYEDIKLEIKNSMVRVVISFVEIGYLLKKIRDEKMYLVDGYKDIWEAAEKEFGLKRKQAWSFMNINDKYSVDGNSTELLPQYEGFSKSTLTEMLTLPYEDYDLITKETRIEDIRELKQAEQEQEKELKKKEEHIPGQVSILDMMTEVVPEQDKKPKMEELTQADAIKRLFRPKEMRACLNEICTLDTGSMALEYWVEDINPSGNRMDKVMPYFIFFYKYQDGVKIKNIVTQEIVSYTYLEFCGLVRGIFGSIGAEADYWSKEFGAEYEAEMQRQKEEKQRRIKENQEKTASEEPEKAVSEEKESENAVTLKENAGSGDSTEEKNKNIVSLSEENKEIVSERTENEKEEVEEEPKAAGTDEPAEVHTEEKPEVVEGEVENTEKDKENDVCDIAQDWIYVNRKELSRDRYNEIVTGKRRHFVSELDLREGSNVQFTAFAVEKEIRAVVTVVDEIMGTAMNAYGFEVISIGEEK